MFDMKKVRSILIVDDEDEPRERIGKAFRKDDDYDFKVFEAKSAQDAIDILEAEEKRFDVVVIDMVLGAVMHGGLDLLDFLRTIKVYMPKIKIVYTGYPSYENCVKAMKAGATNYIEKHKSESLITLINSVKDELRKWAFDEHEPDHEWLKNNLKELKEKYKGQLIAFIDGKIVASASTVEELRKDINEKFPGINPFIMHAPMEA
jgi:DNA-binding NtrC family response regulator